MVSQTAEYALRAVVYLAMNPGPRTTEEIAASTKVPPAYLSKIMSAMTRAGLVASRRGVRGGFVLTKEPQDITILSAMSTVEPIYRVKSCPIPHADDNAHLCPLHQKLDAAFANAERVLAQASISDIIEQQQNNTPLCILPSQSFAESRV
ncbi:MAG TPA: Rrf2 family transcriptional regulator [Candidatus Obscuribacterales bacterium]